VDEMEDEGEGGDDSDEEEVSDRSAAEVQAVERLLALEKAADARARAGKRRRTPRVRLDSGQIL
jgi:hypothetical protein